MPVVLAILAAGDAFAQGTGTVASPVVRPGVSVSAAAGLAFDDDREGVANRFDYRLGVSEQFRVSAMIFANDRGGAYRYRRFAAEAMYQFASGGQGWSSAVQVRGFIPDGNDGPGRVRLAWLNRWRTVNEVELRAIALVSEEFGDDSRSGLALETRGEITWPFFGSTRLGTQIFSRYNRTTGFGSFDTQRHSVGGVIKGRLSDRVSYRLNALTGVSASAADFEARVRLSYAL